MFGQVYREGLWINQKMIDEGWARYCEQYSTDKNLAKVEAAAKQAKKGIWAESNSSLVSDKTPASNGQAAEQADQSGEQIRTWTDESGKFRVRATLVRVNSDKVSLEREDGKVVSVPLSKLSKADRAYLAKRK